MSEWDIIRKTPARPASPASEQRPAVTAAPPQPAMGVPPRASGDEWAPVNRRPIEPAAKKQQPILPRPVNDVGIRIGQTVRSMVGGFAGTPVNVLNTLTSNARGAVGYAERLGIDVPDAAKSLVRARAQPQMVKDFRARIASDNALHGSELSPEYQQDQAGFEKTEGFWEPIKYLAARPGFTFSEAIGQIPQAAAAIPGSLPLTLISQALSIGSQAEQGVAAEAESRGMPAQDVADAGARAFQLSAPTAALGAVVPGGLLIERMLAGQIGQGAVRGAAARAARAGIGVGGEAGSEYLQEGWESIAQDIALGDEIDVGAAHRGGVMGGMLGGMTAAPVSIADALMAQSAPPQGDPTNDADPAAPAPGQAPAAEAAARGAPAAEPAEPAPQAVDPLLTPEGLSAALEGLAPRVPPAPEIQPGTTREQLVEAWRQAQTDEERAAAASAVAAFDVAQAEQAAPQASAPAPAPTAPAAPPAPDEPAATAPAAPAAPMAPTPSEALDGAQPVQAPDPAPLIDPTEPGIEPAGQRTDDDLPDFSPLDLRAEIGWDQVGGRLLRQRPDDSTLNADELAGITSTHGQGEVSGRTTWVAKAAPDGSESTFWRNRPVKWTEAEANTAMDRFERGEPLTRRQQSIIDYATDTARSYAEAERDAMREVRAYDAAQQQSALAEIRAAIRSEIADADGAEALSLYELARKAAERGADEFDLAQASNESNGAYAARMWQIIRGDGNGTDSGTAQGDRGEGAGRREGGGIRVAEGSGQAGLFPAPTAREAVEAARRDRDAKRDGRDGTGRTDIMAGDGELFAGPRPEQTRVEASRDMFTRTRGDRQREQQQAGQPLAPPDLQRAAAPPSQPDLLMRADATPELTRRGQFAIDRLVEMHGGSVIADTIARDFREEGRAALLGQVIRSPEDFAALADAYRNPVFETLRYVFTDESGRVVHETAVSSRLPGVTVGFPTGIDKWADGMGWLLPPALERGAKRVWLMHNHPSGNPKPSPPDYQFTKTFNQYLQGSGLTFDGHVVLNHNKFGFIPADGLSSSIRTIPGGRPDRTREIRGDLAGRPFDPAGAAAVGKTIMDQVQEPGSGALITIGNGMNVHAISALPASLLSNPKRAAQLAIVLGKRRAGAFNIAVIPSAVWADHGDALKRALRSGILADVIAVSPNGNSASVAGPLIGNSLRNLLERAPRSDRGIQVYEGEPGLESVDDAPVFFSAMARAVEAGAGAPRRADAAAWKGWLDGAQRRGEFKQSERDWLGVDAWLDSRIGPVARGELAEFVRSNEVRIEEVTLGQPKSGADEDTGTSYESYQLPGGENYRELLLTLPNAVQREAARAGGETGVAYWNAVRQQQAGAADEYRSSHWNVPNVLAHVRFNERTDVDGKRVLFIEEIQSDWHQAGRRGGYAKNPLNDRERQELRRLREGGNVDARQIRRMQELQARDFKGNAVPDAPMKGTDEWAMLAFKRMVRHAAENGFDRIAWTTGEVQADRYDLGKSISAIIYSKNANGTYSVQVDAHQQAQLFNERSVSIDRIEDLVGKEVAQKIANGEGVAIGGETVLYPDDLKIGGEGMRAFYDKILPSAVNKWAKKLGGRVGSTAIPAPVPGFPSFTKGRTKSAHALDITPQMRDAALQGQPLFNEERSGAAPAESLSAEDSRRLGAEDAERTGMRAAVDEAFGAGRVTFLRGHAGLPGHLRRGVQRRMDQRGGRGRTAGLYDPESKQVYLFTDVLQSPERALWTAAHEIAGHHGLRELLGDKLDRALELALQNPTVSDLATAVAESRNIDQRTQAGRMLAAEEALAELAAAVRTGDYERISTRYGVEVGEGIRAPLRATIDAFLRRLRILLDDLFNRPGFSDEDVRALLEAAWQASRGDLGDGSPDSPSTALQNIEPAGQTDTAAFRRWFGDSKVVDANGEPLVVYHGTTGDFDAFSPKFQGKVTRATSSKGGIFFASTPRTAQSYADHGATVTPVEELVSRAEEAGDRGDWDAHDRLMQEAETLESSMAGDGRARGQNIMPVYLSIKNPMVVDAAGENPQGIGGIDPLIRRAKAAGHDGVIIRNFDDAAGLYDELADHYIVFRPEQIKSATGNRGTFDPDSANILESVVDTVRRRSQVVRRLANAYVPPPRTPVGMSRDRSEWIGLRRWRGEIRDRLQDRMIALQNVQADIEAQTGQALDDAYNAYRTENLMRDKAGDMMRQAERTFVQPMIDELRKAKIPLAKFEGYLLARATPEINEKIARIRPGTLLGGGMPDGGSGLLTAQAEAILAGTEPEPFTGTAITPAELRVMKSAARHVDAMRRWTLDTRQAAGLLSKDQRAALDRQEFYVPARGFLGEEDEISLAGVSGRRPSTMSTRSTGVRRAFGRGAGNLPADIVANMLDDAQHAAWDASTAEMKKSILRLALKYPNESIWRVEPVDMEWRIGADGMAYQGVKNSAADARNSVMVPHEGKFYRVRIEDPFLQRALLDTAARDLGVIMRTFAWINRWQASVFTRFNPLFPLVALARGGGFGMTYVASRHGARVALEAAAGAGPAMRGLFEDGRSPGDASVPDSRKSWADWAREARAAGAQITVAQMAGVRDNARDISRELQTVREMWARGDSVAAVRAAGRRSVGRVLDVIEEVNNVMENALRLSTYVALRRRGASPARAAETYKEMMTNFRRRGRWTDEGGALWLFFNPAMQGAKAFASTLKDPRVVALLGSLGAYQAAVAWMLMGMDDDEDGVTAWDAIEPWKKERSLIIPIGFFTGDHRDNVYLPLEYGFNLFPYVASRTAQAAHDEMTGRERPGQHFVSDIARVVSAAFSPIPFDETGGLFGNVVSIYAKMKENRDDLGRPITSGETFAREGMPRSSMGNTSIDPAFTAAATALNRIGGGDDYTAPHILPQLTDVSPQELQFLFSQITGGIGNAYTQSTRLARGLEAGIYPETMDKVNAIPIVRQFTGRANDRMAVASEFYDQANYVMREVDRFRDAFARGTYTSDEDALQAFARLRDEGGPILAGVELDTYADSPQNRRQGRAGQIKTAPNGRPQIKRAQDTILGELEGYDYFIRAGGRNVRRRQKGAMDQVRELNKQIAAIRAHNATYADLGDYAPAGVDMAAEASQADRDRAIDQVQRRRMEIQQRWLRSVNDKRRESGAR